MFALPAPMPAAIPVEDTVAMALGEDDHVTGMPEIGTPLTSFTTAVTCASSPILMLDALTLSVMKCTAAFGATDVTTALADLPSELAVTVTLPPLIAETRPLALTLAMFASD